MIVYLNNNILKINIFHFSIFPAITFFNIIFLTHIKTDEYLYIDHPSADILNRTISSH